MKPHHEPESDRIYHNKHNEDSNLVWQQYQEKAVTFLEVEDENTYDYLVLGLHSEKGEVAGVVKRYLRGDYDMKETKRRLIGELGDCLWYVAVLQKKFPDQYGNYLLSSLSRLVSLEPHAVVHGLFNEKGAICEEGIAVLNIAKEYGLSVKEIFNYNIQKLTDRKKRNMIKGDGDSR